MGGLLIVAGSVIPYLIVHDYGRRRASRCSAAMLGCAAIGFADDWLKVIRKRSLGPEGPLEAARPDGWSRSLLSLVAHHQGISTEVFVPIVDFHVDLGPAWYVLVFLMVARRHQRREPDRRARRPRERHHRARDARLHRHGGGRLPGRPARVTACLTIDRTSVLPECRSVIQERLEFRDQSLDLAILAAALLGACIGFLWYNAFPADVFMGDTGSLALGGAVAAFAVFTKTELLLPLVGGVFVVEALSRDHPGDLRSSAPADASS